MTGRSEIHTEFESSTDDLESGIEKEIAVDETFVFDGERVDRETKLQLLEDGGVHIVQKVQGCFDSLTLNEDVARRLLVELGSGSDQEGSK